MRATWSDENNRSGDADGRGFGRARTINVAILGNNQAFTDEVREAAREVGERFWELPMERRLSRDDQERHRRHQKLRRRNAGTITAAYFLREFAEDTPWVHLDIAGTAWETNGSLTRESPTGVAYEH